MFQLPVEKLELLRQSRKRVKAILCDIGLDSCKHLLEELKCFDAGDDTFENTAWSDLTDSAYGKRRRKWLYRREALCCALCWFSTRSWYAFRSHVQRCHDEELDLSSLAACSSCAFVSHPDVTRQHSRMFHAPAPPQAAAARSLSTSHVGDRYSCRGCGFHDSLIYVMRKHVLVDHYGSLLSRYYGHRSPAELQRAAGGGAKLAQFFCRLCLMPAETSEHLLYHILSSDKHSELHGHLRPFIMVHDNNNTNKGVRNGVQQRLPSLAPRTVQRVVSLLSKANGPAKAAASSTPSSGAVLLAAPPSTTAVLCTSAPGSRQLLLRPPGKGLVLTGLRTSQTSATLLKGGPLGMLLPGVSQSTSKPLPITIRVPQPPRQVMLPPGMQVIQGSAPRGGPLPSQSVRLVPTGNQVNGMPTYTLETVTMATLPGGAVATGPVLVTQNMLANRTTAQAANQIPSSSRTQSGAAAEKPRALAVQSQVLKKMDNNQVKCLRCKILLTEKAVFQHLLHGLRCLFCPLVFYSIRQAMEHTEREHSLAEGRHRDFLRREFSLQTDDQGGLQFPPPHDTAVTMVTAVPRDLLGCRRLDLLLVTGAKDRLYLRMSEEGAEAARPSPASGGCPFCPATPRSSEEYELHLKSKHHVVPTIHAILRSPAFKCVYCLGVYADRSTCRTVSIHVQRCRCAPRAAKEAERLLNPDGPPAGAPGQGQGGQGQARDGAGAASGGVGTTTTLGNKPPKPGSSSDPPVPLLLDPTGLEMRPFEERKQFLGRYFHLCPYLSRGEVEALAARLWFRRTDVASLFASKRSVCLRAIQRSRPKVLMGFNMTELRKLQHSLDIPDVQPGKMNSD